MALIKCPECGKENVSDSAVSCPECGYAIKAHFERIHLEEQKAVEEKALLAKQEAEKQHHKETEKERQQEAVETLEKQIHKSSSEIKKSIIGLIISLPLTILFFYLSEHGSFGLEIIICGIAAFVSGVFLVSGINEKNTASSDLEVAKQNIDAYEEGVEKRRKAYAAQSQVYAAQHPKCPVCGSTRTERIGTMNRAVSVAAVGLASSKIGKQYECKNCKHKW